MIDVDDRLRASRAATSAAAEDLRARALAVDTDPTNLAPHLDSPALRMMRLFTTPAEYRDEQLAELPDHLGIGTCLEKVVGTVELARGDAGVVLAMPGPALAGVVVDVLGGPAQQERFYRRLAGGRTWTFFAMSEPERGNDATAITTRLDRVAPGEYRLYGHKRYIGNGARGGIGVVFARTGPSPLSIRAVLVEAPADRFTATPLPMVGLRGAYLSELWFDGLRVTEDMLLGQHLPPTRRGIWGAMRTFNNMRIQVAALAVGTAYAIHDLVTELRPHAPGIDRYAARIEAARHLVYDMAAQVDHDSEQAYFPSSAKLSAVPLGLSVAGWATEALGPAALFEHPLLEKWCRDVRAFEFMEGTTNIQRLHVAQGYLKGRSDG
ncbi:acyl-CoA dehydrogenase family protein [Actinophytocola sediminis]